MNIFVLRNIFVLMNTCRKFTYKEYVNKMKRYYRCDIIGD